MDALVDLGDPSSYALGCQLRVEVSRFPGSSQGTLPSPQLDTTGFLWTLRPTTHKVAVTGSVHFWTVGHSRHHHALEEICGHES